MQISVGGSLRQLLVQKKFIMALAALVVAVVSHFGLDVSTDAVALIITPLLVYVVGQGVADRGKGAAEVMAQQQGLLGDSGDFFIQTGAAALIAAVKNPERRKRVRAIMLRVFQAIRAAYAGDEDFS